MANSRLFPYLTAALLTGVDFVYTRGVKGCVNYSSSRIGLLPMEGRNIVFANDNLQKKMVFTNR